MAKNPNLPTEQELRAERDQLPEGPEARSENFENLNETVGVTDKSGRPKSPMGDGPKMGGENVYLPARYPLTTQVESKNGDVKTITIVREDR